MAGRYEERLIRVQDYIYANLDGDLSLDRLADEAAMSRFHFHRVFRAMTGESVAQAIRRIRLYSASVALVNSTDPVPDIATRFGYRDLSSFSRAFKAAFAISPGAYRKRGLSVPILRLTERGETVMFEVEITTQPARRVAAIPHKGDYHKIGAAYEKLFTILGSRDLLAGSGNMIGLYLDDPAVVASQDLRSFAAVEIAESASLEAPLEEKLLEAGKYAVLRHVGPYTNLPAAYSYLFGDWLPKSGAEIKHALPHEQYLNSPMDTAQEDLVTLITMPLKD